jgi:hypothetical protein
MSECSAVNEAMPLLLTESLDAGRRELAHQHIESCPVCSDEWSAFKETWAVLGDLPEVEVPARVRAQFLERAGLAQNDNVVALPQRERIRDVAIDDDKVVPFRRRAAFKWIAQAAAVVLLAGGGYLAGHRTAPLLPATDAQLTSIAPRATRVSDVRPMSIAETRVIDADAVSPIIEGRPNIANVQLVDSDASDNQIGVAFDITSRWTVTGSPKDKSMVRLLSYMLENEGAISPRSNAMEWVRRTYSDPQNANPEIANALAKVLRSSDSHEGVRIRAVETLTNLPPAVATQTRDALISALQSDPNPAVRIKAVEALANMARSGAVLDQTTVDTLRSKAAQNDENLYVRVKAAEALSNIKPE